MLTIRWSHHGIGTMTCDLCGTGATIEPDLPYLGQTVAFQAGHDCSPGRPVTGSNEAHR
jgi:hypothetical protein